MALSEYDSRLIIKIALWIIILASIEILMNKLIFKFPGNNYFPPQTLTVGLSLGLMLQGVSILWGEDTICFNILYEILIYFIIMVVVVYATIAVQYTFFPPIDRCLLKLDKILGIDQYKILTWTNSKPILKFILEAVYASLPFQMCCLPVLIIFLKKTQALHEYYFGILLSTLIGFLIYYFLPTLGPASVIETSYFDYAQKATHIKFEEIHNHIRPSTIEGGLIAFPSFHVLWAYYCTRLLRFWFLGSLIIMICNIILVISCLLLGWHYFIDIITSAIIIVFIHYFYKTKVEAFNSVKIINLKK